MNEVLLKNYMFKTVFLHVLNMDFLAFLILKLKCMKIVILLLLENRNWTIKSNGSSQKVQSSSFFQKYKISVFCGESVIKKKFKTENKILKTSYKKTVHSFSIKLFIYNFIF